MSGVRTGSRLDQLQALRRRVTAELEYATRRGHPTTELHHLARALDDGIRAEGGTPPPTPPDPVVVPRRRTTGPNATDRLLADLDVTTTTVREWAIQHGVLTGRTRGRIALSVVQAYAVHQQLDRIITKTGPAS